MSIASTSPEIRAEAVATFKWEILSFAHIFEDIL